jgi:hypothetical protein
VMAVFPCDIHTRAAGSIDLNGFRIGRSYHESSIARREDVYVVVAIAEANNTNCKLLLDQAVRFWPCGSGFAGDSSTSSARLRYLFTHCSTSSMKLLPTAFVGFSGGTVRGGTEFNIWIVDA